MAAPDDAYRRRLFTVVEAALLRPLGARQNRRQVLYDRCRRLRAGGELEALFREVCPQRRRGGESAQPRSPSSPVQHWL